MAGFFSCAQLKLSDCAVRRRYASGRETVMVLDPIARFVESVRHSRLLEPVQFTELAEQLAVRFADVRSLARELVRRGWLTAYQASQLLLGRGRDLILGPYVLLERLGEGGMGQVFKAKNVRLDKIVALKLIRKDRLTNAESVRRFQREVRAAAQLNHPNVVHAYDSGEAGDKFFFVMEYVEGIDLAKLVQQQGPLPITQACDCVRQAALGLQHAFERGLVHRDIKPHNLLLESASGRVMILDMGLARTTEPAEFGDSSAMTQVGAILGTVDYIAPEQALDARSADIRSDLYSLGCTLYYLLAGQPPFAGSSPTEKLLKHQLEQPAAIEQVRPDVPSAVAAILRKLMAKCPSERYQTPAECVAALASILSTASVTVTAAPATGQWLLPPEASRQSMADTAADWSSIVSPPDVDEVPTSPRPRRPAQRPHGYILGGGIVLLLGLILLLALLPRGDTPRTGTEPLSVPSETRRAASDRTLERWAQGVSQLLPERQITKVAEKLRELNPGFDDKLNPTIEERAVRRLEFSSDNITDIAPLRALTALKVLHCAGHPGRSRLENLAPLRWLPRLTSLNCSGTQVSDLSPLKNLPLTFLDCRNTRVTDLSPLRKTPLREIMGDFQPGRDAEILRSIVTLERINGRPAVEFGKP